MFIYLESFSRTRTSIYLEQGLWFVQILCPTYSSELTHGRNSTNTVNEQMNECQHPQEMTQTPRGGRLPECPWPSRPMTFGSSKAVVNVLVYYTMSHTHSITAVSPTCAYTHVRLGTGAGTGIKPGSSSGSVDSRALTSRWLSLPPMP